MQTFHTGLGLDTFELISLKVNVMMGLTKLNNLITLQFEWPQHYVREMTAKKSCKYGKYGSDEHLLFFVFLQRGALPDALSQDHCH